MPSTLNSFLWKLAERTSAQVVSLVVSIVLARVLMPSDFGVVAMVMIFITLANVLVESGFSSALIQKKDADIVDFSTVFFFSLFFSLILYIVLFFCAPFISSFYGKGYEILTPVLRVLGLQIMIYAVNSVQQAYVSKKMMFKKFFWATLVGTLISGAVGLSMAWLGCGVWSIVGQQLTMTTVNTLTLYAITRKRPQMIFSFERLRGLFSFGASVLGTNLLITVYQELRALIIGKVYSSQDLAYFDRGRQFPSLAVNNINASISAVLFPKIALEQDDISKVRSTVRNSIRMSSFVMFPILLGMAAMAEPLVRLLLTDKWLPCVPILQLMCIVNLFQPIYSANSQALKAIGKSNTLLKIEILKKVIELVTLLMVMRISVMAIVVNMVVMAALFVFAYAYPNKSYIGYSFANQFGDIMKPFSLALAMAIVMYGVNYINISSFLIIIIQAIIGVVIYAFLTKRFMRDEYQFVIGSARTKLTAIYEKVKS